MSAGTRGAVDSITTAEVGRQEGRTGTTGVSRSTGQRIGLEESGSSVASNIICDQGRTRRKIDGDTERILGIIP